MAAPADKIWDLITDVQTSSPFVHVYYWLFGGWLRQRRNVRDMTKTLNRIKDVAEA